MTSGRETEPKVDPVEVSFDGGRLILELRTLFVLEALESPSVEILELFRPKRPILVVVEFVRSEEVLKWLQ